MRGLKVYSRLLNKNDYSTKEVFDEIFLKELSSGIQNLNYYNTREFVTNKIKIWEPAISFLNEIKDEEEVIFFEKIRDEFKNNHLYLLKTLFFLCGVRLNNLRDDEELEIYNDANVLETFKFSKNKKLEPEEIEKWIRFFIRLDIYRILKETPCVYSLIKGIEIGLFSNKRKNISGDRMEQLVYECISEQLKLNDKWEVIKNQSSYLKLYPNNQKIKDTMSRSKMDLVIRLKSDVKKAVIVEVNYYNAGGSKIDKTISEYSKNQPILRNEKIPFLWITDGAAWKRLKKDGLDAFKSVDFIFNIQTLKCGALLEVLNLFEKEYFI